MESTMSDTTGQKPTKNCRMCEAPLIVGDNITIKRWEQSVYYCQACERIEMKNRRMFVNGEYISINHPLHKPGRYKGFSDAAFSSLENYSINLEGEVYVLYNPSFPSWCKVGMAVDAVDRLKQYQTSSPYRNYKIIKKYSVDDRREAELEAHSLLGHHYDRKGEWFVCSPQLAVDKLDELFEGRQLELFK